MDFEYEYIVGLGFLALAALLGFLIAWLWRSSKIDAIKDELEACNSTCSEMTSKLKKAERDVKEINNKYNAAEQSLVNFKSELDPLKASIGQKDTTISQLKAQLSQKDNHIGELNLIKNKYDELLPKFDINTNVAEQLDGEMDSVRFERDNLKNEVDILTRKFEAYKIDNEDIINKYATLKADYDALKAEGGASNNDADIAGLQNAVAKAEKNANAFKAKWSDLQMANTNFMNENEALKARIADLEAQSKVVVEAPKVEPPTPSKPETKEDKEAAVLARIKEKAKDINYDLIGIGNADDKDDLKLIKGIGPFIEKKLNAISIYKFAQIAKFDEVTIEKVNNAIEFFPGRVKRDDWRGQATELIK